MNIIETNTFNFVEDEMSLDNEPLCSRKNFDQHEKKYQLEITRKVTEGNSMQWRSKPKMILKLQINIYQQKILSCMIERNSMQWKSKPKIMQKLHIRSFQQRNFSCMWRETWYYALQVLHSKSVQENHF